MQMKVKIIIIPIYNKSNRKKILKYSNQIKSKLKDYRVEVDSRDYYSAGWKFNEWELKGVPFRIEIGEKETKGKKITLYTRNTGKKQTISIKNLNLKKRGKEFDGLLRSKADKFLRENIVYCKSRESIKTALKNKKIVKADFCSVEDSGEKCAEHVEKEMNAEIKGTLATKKENPRGRCIICNKPAKEVVYIGTSY